ncbi:hypothetical protein J2S09_003817 [Bacillus fengqiuensis]|nr:hypothetical protein [Bacillus fengqiuensis]
MRRNKFLVLSRVSDDSLHKEWIFPTEDKNFDLFLEYYGDHSNRYAEDCQYYSECKTGSLFPRMYEIIKNNPIVFDYDAICIACDDISTNATNINKMFNIFMGNNLWLAQPALTRDSYYSHGITLQEQGNILRYTNFVESMMPIFTPAALSVCWNSFGKSQSGWGLDLIWPKLLGYPMNKIGIIDETPVKHSRPVGGGTLYKDVDESQHEDLVRICQEYKLTNPFDFKTFGTVKM